MKIIILSRDNAIEIRSDIVQLLFHTRFQFQFIPTVHFLTFRFVVF
jgi:hypothetical protein